MGGQSSRQLEIPVDMGEPSLSAMNSSGAICGSISISRDNTDGDRSRPAYWDQTAEFMCFKISPWEPMDEVSH
jgi:hypothetical protein